MALVVTGQSNKEIARALAISPRTVETHRARINGKDGSSLGAGFGYLGSLMRKSKPHRSSDPLFRLGKRRIHAVTLAWRAYPHHDFSAVDRGNRSYRLRDLTKPKNRYYSTANRPN